MCERTLPGILVLSPVPQSRVDLLQSKTTELSMFYLLLDIPKKCAVVVN